VGIAALRVSPAETLRVSLAARFALTQFLQPEEPLFGYAQSVSEGDTPVAWAWETVRSSARLTRAAERGSAELTVEASRRSPPA
jgi:hypothetical protein